MTERNYVVKDNNGATTPLIRDPLAVPKPSTKVQWKRGGTGGNAHEDDGIDRDRVRSVYACEAKIHQQVITDLLC